MVGWSGRNLALVGIVVLWPGWAGAGGTVAATASDGVGQGTAAGPVNASVAEVVEVLRSCGAADEWLPHTLWSDEERVDETTALCSGITDLPWPIADRTWTVRAVESGTEESWSLDYVFIPGSGNMRQMDGSWTVTPVGDGAHIDFVLTVALETPFIPPFLLKWAAHRVLDGVLEGVEAKARAHDGY